MANKAYKKKSRHKVCTLIAIGGHEDREEEKEILREVARRVGKGRLIVTAVASGEPDGVFEQYRRAFAELGLHDVVELRVRERADASDEARLELFQGATGIFFTGGDQLRITSQIGDTPLFEKIQDLYRSGGVVAGTSAGASVLCSTMLVSGNSEESHRVADVIRMAPGLGLIQDVIIDQHFAERGRMGRLVGAVAQNPRALGLGIDENTAIVIENNASFFVLGGGAVYVVDGSGVTRSNIAEGGEDQTLSIYDVRLHLLSRGNSFSLETRRPGRVPMKEAKNLERERVATSS